MEYPAFHQDVGTFRQQQQQFIVIGDGLPGPPLDFVQTRAQHAAENFIRPQLYGVVQVSQSIVVALLAQQDFGPVHQHGRLFFRRDAVFQCMFEIHHGADQIASLQVAEPRPCQA